jgi:hypothetical protein
MTMHDVRRMGENYQSVSRGPSGMGRQRVMWECIALPCNACSNPPVLAIHVTAAGFHEFVHSSQVFCAG